MGLGHQRDGRPDGDSEARTGFRPVEWTNLNFYYLVFVIFVICFVILRRIVSSSFGRTLVGIRLNEQRMRSLGFNTWRLKYVGQ